MVVLNRRRRLPGAGVCGAQAAFAIEQTMDAVRPAAPPHRQSPGDGTFVLPGSHADRTANASFRQAPFASRDGTGCRELLDPARSARPRAGNHETTVLKERV